MAKNRRADVPRERRSSSDPVLHRPIHHSGPIGSRRSRAQYRSRASARFYGWVSAGTFLPGAGLLGTRFKWVGRVFLGLILLAAIAVILLGALGNLTSTVLDFAVSTTKLRIAIGVVLVVMIAWLVSLWVTARSLWPPFRRGRWIRVAFAVFMSLVVVAPSAVAARYFGVQANLIQTVFKGTGGTVLSGNGPDPWKGVDRVNIALIGSDAGTDRVGVRTDSMMVVSINAQTGDTLLVGVPRNLENVPIPESNPLHTLYPDGYNCGDECLMNGIWTLATDHPDLFPNDPNPGLTSTLDVLGAITGLDINRSVVIDLNGFQQLVDAMGGVDVNVQQRVCVACSQYPGGGIKWTHGTEEWIEPGLQHLDGYHALWYARSRAGSDDFSRMRRQRCVAGALLQQADPASMFRRYPLIAQAVQDNVRIDIPQQELNSWVDLVLRIQKGDSIRSLPLTNSVVNPGAPDFVAIQSLVNTSLTPPIAAPTQSPSESPSESESPSPSSSPSPSVSESPNDGTAESISATC